jgi:hypothetical protein
MEIMQLSIIEHHLKPGLHEEVFDTKACAELEMTSNRRVCIRVHVWLELHPRK